MDYYIPKNVLLQQRYKQIKLTKTQEQITLVENLEKIETNGYYNSIVIQKADAELLKTRNARKIIDYVRKNELDKVNIIYGANNRPQFINILPLSKQNQSITSTNRPIVIKLYTELDSSLKKRIFEKWLEGLKSVFGIKKIVVYSIPQGEKKIGTKFYNIDTGERIEQINDIMDRVVAINKEMYFELKDAYNNRSNYYKSDIETLENNKLTDYILSKTVSYNLNLTYKEFNELAGTLYAEGSGNSGSWQEAAAIYSVLENRAIALTKKDKTTTPLMIAAAPYQHVDGWSGRNKINFNTAKKETVNNAQLGLIKGIIEKKDYSNGAYYWHGVDFGKTNSLANKDFYQCGFKFTNSKHDIWGLKDKSVPKEHTIYPNNNTRLVKKWNYKYESTEAINNTTFMRKTEEFVAGQCNTIEKYYEDNDY